jgi:tRNA pseudouridine38-40 synthase
VIYHYRIILQYKGTKYLGWQAQPSEAGETIQGELNKALQKISKSEHVRTLGAGRTDAGVHALGQVVKASIELQIEPENLLRALNVNLPDDIRASKVDLCDEAFFPTVHAKSKEYHYRFTFNRDLSAFQNDLITNYPFDLNLQKMREACQILVGTHDFSNFFCEGTDVSHNVREIYECEILHIAQDQWMLPEHFVFRIVGNGFLKQMVRLLVGTIWNIGRGKVSLEELKASLGPKKLKKLGPVAPPGGLYMVRVNY